MGVTMVLKTLPSLTQAHNSGHRRCSRSRKIYIRQTKGRSERSFRLVAMGQACDDGTTIGQGDKDTSELDLDLDVERSVRIDRDPTPAERLAHLMPGKCTVTERVNWGVDTSLANQVQLSVYPDCIGPEGKRDIPAVAEFVSKCIGEVAGGVHILPFYPSSADRGFAPLSHKEVNKDLGSWDDLQSISSKRDLCVDYMVNHISAQSKEFKDFVSKGDKSEYAPLFIRYNDIFEDGDEEAVKKIYTRAPTPPFLEITHDDGSSQKVWSSFSEEQIDINTFSNEGRDFISDQVTSLCATADLVRLDAFGYTTKRKGTNCFFVQPDVWELLHYVQDQLKCKSTELLCEVHDHYIMQKALAEHSIWAYDFCLPFLVLQTLYDADADNLKAWWLKCPRKQVTTLDTHDGIPVVDLGDVLTTDQVNRTQERILANGANVNDRYNPKAQDDEVYQLNIAYFSAVEEDEAWYLLARALQFFTPGVPLVYYVGLLAGANDAALVEETGTGRDINRHPYTVPEAEKEMKRPVVKALMDMCKLRNTHPAFNGSFEVLDAVVDIQQYSEQLHALEPGSSSAFLTERLGMPAHVAVSLDGSGWFIDQLLKGATDEPKLSTNGALQSVDMPSGDISEGERLFHPCSAALENVKNGLMSPVDTAHGRQFSVSERSALRRRALQRDVTLHVPRNVAICRWSSADHWAVLEVDLCRKAGRIVFSEEGGVGVFDIGSVLSKYHEAEE